MKLLIETKQMALHPRPNERDVIYNLAYEPSMHDQIRLTTYLAQSPVPIIRDMPAVHDLAKEVPQILPGNPVVGLQIVEEDVGADDEVARVERVRLVPPLR